MGKYHGFKILLTISLLLILCGSFNLCPANCRCYEVFKFSITCNCSWANLQRIPNRSVDVTTTKLLASHNNLTSLENNTFAAFPQLRLTTISLDHNVISEVDSNSFKGLKNLKQLSVSHNMIVNLRSATFADTKRLQELYVSDNVLTKIHPKLLKMNSHLRVFDAANNRIRFLPSDLFMNNTKLIEVCVNGNELSFLNNEQFQHNPGLKTVRLENNNIIFLQLGTFGHSKVPLYVNVSNNAIQSLQSSTDCHMATMNVTYTVASDSLCQTYRLGEMVTVDIRGNPLLCDSRQEEVAVLCCNYSTYVVRQCASGTTRISSAEFNGRRLQKREMDVTTLSEKTSGLTSSSVPVTGNYRTTVDSSSVTDTAIDSQEIKCNMSSNSSGNATQLFGEAYQLATMQPSEETEKNLTKVVTLIQYDSALAVSEAITRGVLLIGAEIMLALFIVLRKFVLSRFKKDTDDDRMELVPVQDADAMRQMEIREDGDGERLVKSDGDADNEDIKSEDGSEKGDGDE